MRSRHHFPISLAVGVCFAVTLETALPDLALVAVAGLLGTFVDLDHFLIARLRTGSWSHLRRCLADPRMALFDQHEIFEEGDVGTFARLWTHTVITAGIVAALWTPARSLALALGAVLVVHIGCDIAWELWRWRRGMG